MQGFGRIRHYSSGSDASDYGYGYGHNQEYLTSIQQSRADAPCIRCNTKVYPPEKVDVGIQLHRKCFRCRECDIVLTLNTFILAKVDERGWKEVFCKSHAPKPSKNTLDPEAMGIKTAVNIQQRYSFSQQHQRPDVAGWNLDPNAIEFAHAKSLQERNRFRRPRGHDLPPDDLEEYEKGSLIRQLREGELERDKVRDIAGTIERSPRSKHQTSSEHHHRDPSQDQPKRKFPIHSEYMPPNAIWSAKPSDDPWQPLYMSEGTRNPSGRGYHGNPGNPSQEGLVEQEMIYADSNVFFKQPEMYREDSWDESEELYGNLLLCRGNASERGQILQGPYSSRDAIYESLRPSQSAPELPPKLPSKDGRGGRIHPAQRSVSQDGRQHRNRPMPAPRSYENHQFAHQPQDLTRMPRTYDTSDTFLAQNKLEIRQRHEQGQMFRDFEKTRENQIEHLEEKMRQQMKKAVDKLLMDMDTGNVEGDIEVEKLKVEDHFYNLKEEQLRMLMTSLSQQERVRFDNLIDRHTQEMLQLIDQKVPAKLPSPRPPAKHKRNLYTSPRVFDDIDFQAVQVAQREHSSFTELVYDLTHGCTTALQKTRAIFRWIAVKDLNQMMFREELTEDSPYYFLKGIKYGLESYHELFKRLCSYAGLSVRIIRGLSKSAGYRPGMTFTDTSHFRNSWAVVLIEGDWHFVDCHWGARHVSSPHHLREPHNFCYSLDEFYFLTDPDDMIYMHFPDDPDWQLLEKPISMEGFVDLPVVKSHFFHYGLKFEGQLHSLIESENGTLEISLRKSCETPLAFSSRLEQDGEEVLGYCIHQDTGSTVIFNLILPNKGVFFFTIFACDTDKSDAYNNVCTFRIKCLKVENKPFGKFPQLVDGYGLTNVGRHLGLKAEKFDEFYIVCREDKMLMNVKFRRPVKITQKLSTTCENTENGASDSTCIQMTNEGMERLVFQRYIDKNFVSFVIRFPKRGIFVFSIYADAKESESCTLECACRYVIQCNARVTAPPRPYPKMLQYWYKCRLHEPTSGELKLNKNVKFKLEVPNADAVAVIVGQQWFYLKREDDEAKIWEGVAHTGKDIKLTADVYARYTHNESDFYPLLEYKLLVSD